MDQSQLPYPENLGLVQYEAAPHYKQGPPPYRSKKEKVHTNWTMIDASNYKYIRKLETTYSKCNMTQYRNANFIPSPTEKYK